MRVIYCSRDQVLINNVRTIVNPVLALRRNAHMAQFLFVVVVESGNSRLVSVNYSLHHYYYSLSIELVHCCLNYQNISRTEDANVVTVLLYS